MNTILKISDIMTTALVTVGLDTFISDIVKIMQEKKISSIVIVDLQKPLGIITERDILKASLSPEENLKKTAAELMSSPVYSIREDIDYRDAYMQMSEEKIRHIVVVSSSGELIGILSESNFLNHLNPDQLLAIKEVSTVMSKNVICAKAEDSVYSVLEHMSESRIGGIVIEENNKAVGIVSERDALKLIQKGSLELQSPIKNFMSTPVLTIHKSQTVLNAQSIMESSSIRRLVVVNDDESIVGILTRHDLIKSIPEYYVEILREMIDRQKNLVSQTQVELDEKIIFQNAMKSLPHSLVLVSNENGVINFINRKESMICVIPTIELGTSFDDLHSDFFFIFENENWKEEIHDGTTIHKMMKVKNKQFKNSYFHTSVSAIFNSKGVFEGYMYIARDISQEHTLEEELKRLNENLQEAYKIASIGNWELQAGTLDAVWSDEICGIFGLEANTLGSPDVLKTLVDLKDFEMIENSLISALESGSAHELVYQVFPKNSTDTCWVECRARRALNEDGSTKSLVGTLQNVTHRVESEKRIEHLNTLLKAIRNINQLIVKEKDLNLLMQAICNEITVVEKFSGVWILLKDNKSTLYSDGFDNESLEKFQDNISKGILPSCCNITDKLRTYKEPSVNCIPCSFADSYGNSDAVVVPIIYEDVFYGHIGLSIGNNIIKDEEEQSLVQEMATDIAFSIYTLKEHDAYEKEQMRYKSLVEHSNDAIYIHTLDGVIIDANPALEKIHGKPKSEIIGFNVMDFYPPHQLEIAASHFKTIQEEGTVSFTMELLKIDGTPFQAELVASLVELDGEVVVQGSLRDVTKRFEAEKKAKESEGLMLRALEGTGHGVWDFDFNKKSMFFSKQYKEMLGYSEDDDFDYDFTQWFNLIHPDEKEETQKRIIAFQKSQDAHTSEVFRLRCKDGSYKWILCNATVVEFKDKKPVRIIGTHTDISQQKVDEEKIKQIFNDSPIGIIYIDSDGKLITCNKIFEEIFNIKHLVSSDKSMYEIIKDQQLVEAMKDGISKGIGQYEGWYEAVSSGYAGYGKAIFKGIKDPDGVIRHSIGLISDITQQKKAEDELRLFKRSVEASNEGITITNAGNDESIIYANPAFERLTGYSEEEILGQNLRILSQENRNQPEIELLHEAIKNQTSIQVELKNYRKDGSEFISHLSVDPIYDDRNNVTHFVGVQKDVTKERNILNQLKLQSESVEKSHSGINIIDKNGLFTYVNHSYLRMWGYEEKDEVLGTSPTSHCLDPGIPEKIIKIVELNQEITIEFRAQRKDGSLFDVLMAVKKIIDNDGNYYYLGSSLDITLLKDNERQLRQSAGVFNNTTEGVMITDANSNIIDVNEAFSEITGFKYRKIIGKNPSVLKSGRHNKAFYKAMWKSILKQGSWQGEIWNRRKNGEIYPQWLNISSVKDENYEIESYIAVFSDISALKANEEKLDFLAHHDHLTGLPNRTLLRARLEHTLSAAKRDNTITSVIFIDIDNFKNINDSYGHTLGDLLLVEVAKRIGKTMREDDTLSRIGGDEFIIVMNHFKSTDNIAHIVQNIMDLFESPCLIEDKEFWITLSIGVSVAPDDGESAETLIKNADTAMYDAKGDGKNTFKFYNDKMSAISFERVLFENALKTGILNKEFEVYYQPQEDLKTGKVIGFEALVRWNHPTLGLVSPARFIPIAEDTKMILEIGEFVLNQACTDIKKWHKEGLCKGRIAVNVSGVQLEHSEFAEILKDSLNHYDVDPSMIEVEVTESMVMKNPERWIRILEEIKRIGVSISVDDFGTGYSSLSYLRRLPSDTLKIDQSFIQDIPHEDDACAIVNAIISMADSLGLETLAEGVETIEQRQYLVDRGCKQAQGYLLSRPMSGKDTYSWLQANTKK